MPIAMQNDSIVNVPAGIVKINDSKSVKFKDFIAQFSYK